jgi:uncharacterized protein (TIGR02266 family)
LWQHVVVTGKRAARFDCAIAVDFTYEGHTYQAVTRNMGLGGMYIVTEMAMPMGSTVQLRFRVPTLRDPIEVRAAVRWAEEGLGMGVQFDGLRAREVWALNRFFKVVTPEREGEGGAQH